MTVRPSDDREPFKRSDRPLARDNRRRLVTVTSAPKRDRASRRLRRLWRVVGFIARALWNIGLAELISSAL